MFFNEKKRKLTEKKFDTEVAKLGEWIKGSVSPFKGDTPKKQAERVRRARDDQAYFNRTYLPHYFNQPSAEFHADMDELAEAGEEQKRPVVIAAPRGFAKSTSLSVARVLRKGLYGQKKFVVHISDTELQARGNTVCIRTELEINPRIIHDFGNQKTSQWSAGEFDFAGGMKVLARGSGQAVRGPRNREQRPDLIIVDDLDSDESVRNPKRTKNSYDWLKEAVIPSLDPISGSLIMLGVLISKRSVLAQAIDNPAFLSRTFKAVDNPVWDEHVNRFSAGVSLWPERFSMDHLSRTRFLIGSVSFKKEYQNEPTDDEGLFHSAWIEKHRYRWDQLPDEALSTYQGIDPSVGEGMSNDFKSNITTSRANAKTYVRHAWIKRCSIDVMISAAYYLNERFSSIQVGLEADGWQSLLERDFNRAAEERGRYLPIVPVLRHGLSKRDEARIGGLSRPIEMGSLVFPYGPESEIGDMETLIEQIVLFPSSTEPDDGPDGLETAYHLGEKRVMNKPSYTTVSSREVRFDYGAY